MNKIVGIRFKPAGKIYDFNAGAFVLNEGDPVIVETEQGLGFGYVSVPPRALGDEDENRDFKNVFRLATDADFQQQEENRKLETEAKAFCQSCIDHLGLEMNLFAVEATFDACKMTFFFTADGRVDFRELVKMLVREYRIRIEMRQVGIRNQAKMCGGIGRCGRVLCCTTYLEKFDPVSIRMAKEQGLSLNPTKISGQCGRLMCCLTYENATYMDLKRDFPKLGKRVKTPQGFGKVTRHNVIGRRLAVKLEDGGEVEVDLASVEPSGNESPKAETSRYPGDESTQGEHQENSREQSQEQHYDQSQEQHYEKSHDKPQDNSQDDSQDDSGDIFPDDSSILLIR